MTLNSGLWLAFGAMAAISMAVLNHRLDSVNTDNQTLRRELQTQTLARNTAEWLLDSQIQTMRFFAAIRAANLSARRADETKLNESKQTISKSVAPNSCGAGLVPATAADELRQLEDYARARSGFTSAD